MRAAIIYVIADVAASFLVIEGLTFARLLGWLWIYWRVSSVPA